MFGQKLPKITKNYQQLPTNTNNWIFIFSYVGKFSNLLKFPISYKQRIIFICCLQIIQIKRKNCVFLFGQKLPKITKNYQQLPTNINNWIFIFSYVGKFSNLYSSVFLNSCSFNTNTC